VTEEFIDKQNGFHISVLNGIMDVLATALKRLETGSSDSMNNGIQ
jgi:hypothetical protein